MKRLCCIVLIVFVNALFAQARAPNPYTFNNLDLNDCKIMLIFAHIYDGSQLMKREKAAWIVVNPRGELESVRWLNTPQDKEMVWRNALPLNIVALAHTHPHHLDPRPSKQDEMEARRLNINIFTLSRKGIWSVTPDGIIRQHAHEGWLKDVNQRCVNVQQSLSSTE